VFQSSQSELLQQRPAPEWLYRSGCCASSQ